MQQEVQAIDWKTSQNRSNGISGQTKRAQHRLRIGSGRYTKPYHEAAKVTGKTSIDTNCAVQLGIEKYAGVTLTSKKRARCRALWKLPFARAVEGKVTGVEELVDLLTPELRSFYYLLLKSH